MSGDRQPLFSDAWLVAVRPSRTFDALATADALGSWPRALVPIGFTLLVLATASSVLATRVAAIPTLLSVAACWLFVPLVQLATAMWICRRVPQRRVSGLGPRVSRQRALELLFTAHLPWTLWLIGFGLAAVWFDPGPVYDAVLIAVLVPAIWTPVLLAAFCRTVLGCAPREARRRTAVHQALTWGAVVVFAIATIQPWARYGPFQ